MEVVQKNMQYKNRERHAILRPTMRKGKLRTNVLMLSVIYINHYTECMVTDTQYGKFESDIE